MNVRFGEFTIDTDTRQLFGEKGKLPPLAQGLRAAEDPGLWPSLISQQSRLGDFGAPGVNGHSCTFASAAAMLWAFRVGVLTIAVLAAYGAIISARPRDRNFGTGA